MTPALRALDLEGYRRAMKQQHGRLKLEEVDGGGNGMDGADPGEWGVC
ncbi:MAG: hypothetical protein VKO39_06550 [Cyanobacteriota bacterium]|nr:hypothetical protein [Cyanobacteriota bacterium]